MDKSTSNSTNKSWDSLPSLSDRKAILWLAGNVASWYLKDSQLDVYRLLNQTKRPFIEAARRWGKTTSILVWCLEKLIENPGWICRWAEPEKEQARKIVMPEMDTLQESCPPFFQFRWHSIDSYYQHPNGSRLYLYGVNEDKGRSARGPKAHIVVADEYGFWTCPDAVKTIFAPQLRTTGGWLIKASTPPEDLGHPYYDEKQEAIRDKRFIQKIIYQDEWLTKEGLEEIVKDCGGIESAAFRREYLCEPVADPARLVIPEYDEKRHLYQERKRPKYFDTYVGADLGFNDHTGFVFGYYDFPEATLIIEDETWLVGKNSAEIVATAKAKEESLWGKREVYRRVCDNELQQLCDMSTMLGYSMNPTRKDDKMAAVNALRLRFKQGKIKIHERCTALRFQLQVGLWNERRTDYLRGEKTGHLDLLDALVYLNRNLDESRNPFPAFEGVQGETHFISPVEWDEYRKLKEAFKSPF